VVQLGSSGARKCKSILNFWFVGWNMFFVTTESILCHQKLILFATFL
jgi:hypothetical protein